MKKFNKLLLVSSSLLLAGGVLATYGQLSTNGKPVGQESIADVEKVDLMFLLNDEFEIEPVEGFTLSEEGYASVVKGTKIQFKVKVNDGAILANSGLIVKANDNEIGDVNGVYRATINKDTEIKISGFIDGIIKHRVSINVPYGVSIASEGHEALPDGSYLLEDDKFEFSLSYLPGFKANNLVVKEGENVLTPNAGLYQVTLNKDVTINVSGVEYRQTKIKLDETDLFSFNNIKGAVVVDGYAYVTDENVSFRIIPSKLADLDASTVVVKHSGTVLTPNNGVYSFVPTETSTIEVSGLSKIVESSADTGLSFEREVLAEQSAKTIVTTAGAVVSGEVNHLADVNNGYKKATYFAGEYGSNQLSINSNNYFEKYNHLEFEINPITGDYIEFYSKAKGGSALFYIREKGWTKVELNKDSDGYHYLINGTDKGVVANASTMISDLQFRMQGTYLFSELIAQKDPEYVDPHQYQDKCAIAGKDVVSEEQTEFGTKKWYGPVDSKINTGIALASIETDPYKEIYFEVKVPEDYGSDVWFGIAKNPSWTVKPGNIGKFILTKNINETFDLTFIGADTKTANAIDLGNDLSTLSIFAHSNLKEGNLNVGKFYISNIRTVADENYDPNGQKKVIITDSAEHVSYSVDGQTTSTFLVDPDTTITLRTTPEAGYVSKVVVNGIVAKGVNNVYSITVAKATTIEILEEVEHSIEKVADKFIECATLVEKTYDNTFASVDANVEKMYESTATGETHYALSNINISAYKHLYFYVKNVSGATLQLYDAMTGTSGFKGVGSKGDVSKVSFDNNNGTWSVSIDDEPVDKYTRATTTLSGIFYVQFWGKNYISPLYGYKI